MRYAFFGLIVCACAVARAGEEASVLVAQPAPVTAPAVVVESSNCGCSNGTCGATSYGRTRTRFRSVTEGCDACTGQSVRSVTRGVVRGTGAVVSGVGAAAYNVITLPVRACRNGRCCR